MSTTTVNDNNDYLSDDSNSNNTVWLECNYNRHNLHKL